MQYYYTQNGQQHGPFSIEELQQKPIDKNTLVWKPGMGQWVSAGELAELAAVFQPVVAPPPLPVQASTKEAGANFATWFWRVAAVGSFVVMVWVAVVKLGTKTETIDPEPTPDVTENVVVPEPSTDIVVPVAPKEAYNWREHIKIEYNDDFSIDNIGGVNNLKIIFTNNSEFEITLARAQAIIRKQNGTNIIKEVSFQNVPPGEVRHSEIIETTRGKWVASPVIIQVQSTNGEISYLSGQENKDRIGKLFEN